MFLTVVEKGSLTAAAETLFISVPSVSQSIRALEDKLGVRLFRRNKRSGLGLTDAGERILKFAGQMAQLESSIYQTAAEENNLCAGSVKIASLPLTTGYMLAQALAAFRKKYPRVTVEVREGTPSEVQKLAENGLVDFVVSCSPFGELDHETLILDRMIAVFPPESPVPAVLDLREGAEEHLIICRAGAETVMEKLRDEYRISFAKSFVAETPETVVRLVQEGNGVGVISDFTLSTIPNGLHRCEVRPEIGIEIGIAAYRIKDLTPAARAFVRLVKETCPHTAFGSSQN